MVDRFPAAFERFKRVVVDIDRFKSYRELRSAFTLWAGKRWRDTWKQNMALEREGRKLGLIDARFPSYFRRPQVSAERTWRRETVTVRGIPQVRHRDLRTGRFIRKP